MLLARRCVFIIVLILQALFSSSQVVLWNKGAATDDEFYFSDMKQDRFGDIYITGGYNDWYNYDGQIDSAHTGNHYNFFICKMDGEGQMLWRFDGGRNEIDDRPVGIDLCLDSMGNIYVLGSFNDTIYMEDGMTFISQKAGQADGSMFIAKFSNNGDLLNIREDTSNFIAHYDLWSEAFFYKLYADKDGIAYSTKEKLRKFDYNLNFLGETQFKSYHEGHFHNSNGDNFFLRDNVDTLISKYDSNGNLSWVVTGKNHDKVIVGEDSANNIYLLGEIFNRAFIAGDTVFTISINHEGYSLIKIDDAGNVLWSSVITADNFYEYAVKGLNITDEGVLVVQGGNWTPDLYYDSINEPGTGMFLLGIDAANGNLLWKIDNHQYNFTGPRDLTNYHDKHYSSGFMQGAVDFQGIAATGTSYLCKFSVGNNLISGRVFYDFNKNGKFDTGELPASKTKVKLNGFGSTVITDALGKYRLFVSQGSYTLSPVNPPIYFDVVPTSHSANFTGTSQRDTANDFALQAKYAVNDLSIELTPVSPARPGFIAGYNLLLKNIGTNIMSGHIRMNHAADLSYDDCAITPDSVNSGKLSWEFSAFKPSEQISFNVYFELSSSASIGDTLINDVIAYPVAADSTVWNNYDSSVQIVSGSYDPNDKTLLGGNVLNTFKLLDGSEVLDYQVRFQNTGTDTAFTVRIIDTISDNLDISTFEMVSASHPYTLEFLDQNVLIWTFRDIHLPDSTTNEALSHGFLRFTINASQSISHGDSIVNTAFIYFDFNEVVVTNTASADVSDWASINDVAETSGIHIYPNPAKGIFEIIASEDISMVRVYDLLGKEIYNGLNIKYLGRNAIVRQNIALTGIFIVKVSTVNSEHNSRVILVE